jgi:hypothetical protein
MTQTYLRVLCLVAKNGTRADLSKWTDFAHTYASIVLDVLAGAWEKQKRDGKGIAALSYAMRNHAFLVTSGCNLLDRGEGTSVQRDLRTIVDPAP